MKDTNYWNTSNIQCERCLKLLTGSDCLTSLFLSVRPDVLILVSQTRVVSLFGDTASDQMIYDIFRASSDLESKMNLGQVSLLLGTSACWNRTTILLGKKGSWTLNVTEV